jgi:hypothetical protein
MRDVGIVATWDDYRERRQAAEDVVSALRVTVGGIAGLDAESDAVRDAAEGARSVLERATAALESLPSGAWAWQGWDLSWADEIEKLAQVAESSACALESLRKAGFAVETPSYWDVSQPPRKPPKSIGEGIAEAGAGLGRGLLLLGILWAMKK